MIRQTVHEEKRNHFIKKQIHQQNVNEIIESQMKKNVRRISNDERAQNLRDADVKNLQKVSQIS
jgi:hypothetical protein